MKLNWSLYAALCVASTPHLSFAQPAARADPNEPGRPVPISEYQSAFAGYRPFQEQKGNAWKEVNKEVADNPGMGSMGAMNSMGPMKPDSSKGEGAMAMAMPQPSSPLEKTTAVPDNPISGTGVIQQIDKASSRVKIAHDPIGALGWPKMNMFFRLKDSALADQVKQGDQVGFSLEKSSSGYVISGFNVSPGSHNSAKPTGHDMGKGEKK